MKLLKDLTKKYRRLDDQFFYWWKAQSPVEVDMLLFKLKGCAVAFAVLSIIFIYIHHQSIRSDELNAIREHESKLVEGRRLKKIQEQKTRTEKRQVLVKPWSNIYR